MENASKALILAGAVLLAILIITLGVKVYNNTVKNVDTSGLDEQEILMFNKKWEKYNNSELGSNVKTLISSAIANANTNKDNQYKLPTIKRVDNSGVILDEAKGGTDASGSSISKYIDSLKDIRIKIISTNTYTISLTYDSTGVVNSIEIKVP